MSEVRFSAMALNRMRRLGLYEHDVYDIVMAATSSIVHASGIREVTGVANGRRVIVFLDAIAERLLVLNVIVTRKVDP